MNPSVDAHGGRFVPLAGTMNARDLGGLPLCGGGRTRVGHLYRSDAPLRWEHGDPERLERLGLSTVVDLRELHELEREPNVLATTAGVRVHHVEVWRRIHASGIAPSDPWDITAFYLAALDHAGDAFAQAIEVLAAAPGAALFHCTAGKDRTGVLALLVLDLVGVDREAVVEDFALTEARIEPIRERLLRDAELRGIAKRDFIRLLGATPDLIEPAIDHLERRHGGAEAYLRRNGASDRALQALRTKLRDPSPSR